MRSPSMKGNASSGRRAIARRGSNRAHRRAASRSKAATSEAELQLRIDGAARFLEGIGKLVLESDGGQRKRNQLGIALDPCQPLRLLHQRRTDPHADPPAL